MTAEPIMHVPLPASAAALPPEPSVVQRTSEEKASILARLTLQLAALNNEEGHHDGNA
jgi:hypothetical protein